jgi:transposase
MSNKRKYTQEFRQEAIKLMTEQGYSQAETSKRLGVPHANLSRWIKKLTGDNVTSVLSKKIEIPSAEQKELEALRKENKRLKLEREILKKAAAFFANEKN